MSWTMESEEGMANTESLTEGFFFVRPSARRSIHRKGFSQSTSYSSSVSTSTKSSFTSFSSSSSSATKYQPSLVRTTSTSSSTYSSDESPASSPAPETGTAEFLSPTSWFQTSLKTSESGHQMATLATEESGSTRQSSAMGTEGSSNSRRDFSPVRGWTEGWMKVQTASGQSSATTRTGEGYSWSGMGGGGLLSIMGNWRVWGKKDETPNGGMTDATSMHTDKEVQLETSSETVARTERATVSQTSSSTVITSQSTVIGQEAGLRAGSAMSGDQYGDLCSRKGFGESADHLQDEEDEVKVNGATVQTWNQNIDAMEQEVSQVRDVQQSITQQSEMNGNVAVAASGNDTTTEMTVVTEDFLQQTDTQETGEDLEEDHKEGRKSQVAMVVRQEETEAVELTDTSQTSFSESMAHSEQDKVVIVEQKVTRETGEDVESEEDHKEEETIRDVAGVEQEDTAQDEVLMAVITTEGTTTVTTENDASQEVTVSVVSSMGEIRDKQQSSYEDQHSGEVAMAVRQEEKEVVELTESQTSISESMAYSEQDKVVIVEEKETRSTGQSEEDHSEEEMIQKVVGVEQEETMQDGEMTVITTESYTTVITESEASQEVTESVVSSMGEMRDKEERGMQSTSGEHHSVEMNVEEDNTIQEVSFEETEEVINEAARKRRRTYSGGLMSYILPDEEDEEEEMEKDTSSEEVSMEVTEESCMETSSDHTETVIAGVQESESTEVKITTQGNAESSQQESCMETGTDHTDTVNSGVQESQSMEVDISIRGDAESSQTVTTEIMTITSTQQEEGQGVSTTSSDMKMVVETNEVVGVEKTSHAAASTDTTVEESAQSTMTSEDVIVEPQEPRSTETIKTKRGRPTNEDRRASATIRRKSYFLRNKMSPRVAKLRAGKALEPAKAVQGRKKAEETETRKRKGVHVESNSTAVTLNKKQKTAIKKTTTATVEQGISLVITRVDEQQHSDEGDVLDEDEDTKVAETMEEIMTVSETGPRDEQDEEEKDESAIAEGEPALGEQAKAQEEVTEESITDESNITEVTENAVKTIHADEIEESHDQEDFIEELPERSADQEKVEEEHQYSTLTKVQTVTETSTITKETEEHIKEITQGDEGEVVRDKSITIVSARVVAETPSKGDYWFRSRRKRRLFDTDDGYTVGHKSISRKYPVQDEHKKPSGSVEESNQVSVIEKREKERKERQPSVNEDKQEEVLALGEASTIETAIATKSKAQDEQTTKSVSKLNQKKVITVKTATKRTERGSKDVDGRKRSYWLRGQKAVRGPNTEPKVMTSPAAKANSTETVTETRQSNVEGSLKKKRFFILASTKPPASAGSIEGTVLNNTSKEPGDQIEASVEEVAIVDAETEDPKANEKVTGEGAEDEEKIEENDKEIHSQGKQTTMAELEAVQEEHEELLGEEAEEEAEGEAKGEAEEEAEDKAEIAEQDGVRQEEEEAEGEDEKVIEDEEENEEEEEEAKQTRVKTSSYGRRGNYWLRSKTVYYGSGPSARSGFLAAIATTTMSSGAKRIGNKTTMTSTEETATTESDVDDESEKLDEEVMEQEKYERQEDKLEDVEKKEEESVTVDEEVKEQEQFEIHEEDTVDEEKKEEEREEIQLGEEQTSTVQDEAAEQDQNGKVDGGEVMEQEQNEEQENNLEDVEDKDEENEERDEEPGKVVEGEVMEQEQNEEEQETLEDVDKENEESEEPGKAVEGEVMEQEFDEHEKEEMEAEEKTEDEQEEIQEEQTTEVEEEETEIAEQEQDQLRQEEDETVGEDEKAEEGEDGDEEDEEAEEEAKETQVKTGSYGRRGNYWLRSKTVYYGSGPSARSGFLAAIATTTMSSGAKGIDNSTTMASTEETTTTLVSENSFVDESEKLDEEGMEQGQDENKEEDTPQEEREKEIQIEVQVPAEDETAEVVGQGQEEKQEDETPMEEEEGPIEQVADAEEAVELEDQDEREEGESNRKETEGVEEEGEDEEEKKKEERQEEDKKIQLEVEVEQGPDEEKEEEVVVEIEEEGQDEREEGESDKEETEAVEEEGEDEEQKYKERKQVTSGVGRRGNYSLRSRTVYYGSGPSARSGFLAAIATTSMSSGKKGKLQTKAHDAESKERARGHSRVTSKITAMTSQGETPEATVMEEADLDEESGKVDHGVEVETVENITVLSAKGELSGSELQATTTYFITKVTEEGTKGDELAVDVDTMSQRTTVSTVTTTSVAGASTDNFTHTKDTVSTAGEQTNTKVYEKQDDSEAAVIADDKDESDGDGIEEMSDAAAEDSSDKSKVEENLITMAIQEDRIERESVAKKGKATVESYTEQEAGKVTEFEEGTEEDAETVTRGRKSGTRGNYYLRSKTVYYGSGPSARGGFKAAMAAAALRGAVADRTKASSAKAVLSRKAKKTDVHQASSENPEELNVVEQEAVVMATSSYEEESSEEIQESSTDETVTVESLEQHTSESSGDTTEDQDASNAESEDKANEQQDSEDREAHTSDTQADTEVCATVESPDDLAVGQETDQTSEESMDDPESPQTQEVADVEQTNKMEMPPVPKNVSKKRKHDESSIGERSTKGEGSQKGSRGNHNLRSRTVYYGSGPSARSGFLATIAAATMSNRQGQSVTSRSAKKSSRFVMSGGNTSEKEQTEEANAVTIQDDENGPSEEISKSTEVQGEGAETVSTTIVEGITDEDIEGVLEELSESAASGQMSLEDAMAEAASPKDILTENQEESGNEIQAEHSTADAIETLDDASSIDDDPSSTVQSFQTSDKQQEVQNIVSSSTSKVGRKKRKVDYTETVGQSEEKADSMDVSIVEAQTECMTDGEGSEEIVVRTNTQKESAVESSESPGRSYWLRKRTIAYYYSTGLESPLAVVTKSSTVYETDSKKRNKSSEASTKATKRAITASKEVASKKSRKETTVVQTEGEISSPSETLEESSASEAQSTTGQEVSSTGSMEVDTTSVKVTSSDDSQSEKTETIVMEDGETSSKTILVSDPGTASTSTETTTIITNVEVGSKGLGADIETHEEVMTTTSKTTMRGSRKVGPKTVTKISTLESVEELPEDQHDEKEGEAISAVETEEAITASSEEQGTTSESLLSTGKKSTNKSKTVKTTTVKTSKMKTTSSNVSISHTTVVTKSSSSTRNINSEGSLGQVYSMSLRRMGDGKRRVYTWNT